MSDNPGQPRLGKHGGPRIKGQRSAEVTPSGGRRDYILARLERDGRKDLVEAIRKGHVSAYTVAVELGWTQRPEPIGTGSTNAARRRHFQLKALAGDGLDSNQMQELWLGPSHDGSYFSSRAELQEAWEANRDEVMRLFANNGRRPQAWWCFDAPSLNLKYPGYDREQSYLYEHGVLDEAECAELLRFWRREFEQDRAPGFSLNDGEQILRGARARAAHLAWADIPAGLVEEWSEERRVREARAAESPHPAPARKTYRNTSRRAARPPLNGG
jgi:hypothetical protein